MPPKKVALTPKKVGSTTGANVKKPALSKAKGSPVAKSTVASKKKSTSPKKSATSKDQTDTKRKVATKEDVAATKIQSHFRVLLAKKELSRRKRKKEHYEEEMERLEREVRSFVNGESMINQSKIQCQGAFISLHFVLFREHGCRNFPQIQSRMVKDGRP